MIYKGYTDDSMSFESLYSDEFEIPVYPHVGSYGARRKYDVHKGIDLYCPTDTLVRNIKKGVVKHIFTFTGEEAGSPWWNKTSALVMECKKYQILYGEITVNPHYEIGDTIDEGCNIGRVKPVLKKDKGRPMSMLHIEKYPLDATLEDIREIWKLDDDVADEKSINPLTLKNLKDVFYS